MDYHANWYSFKAQRCIILFSVLGFMNSNANASTVSSATSSAVVNSPVANSFSTTMSELKSADPYVTVKGNQFVFNTPNDGSLSQSVISEVQSNIESTNKQISEHHGVINPSTKEITFRGDLVRRKSHEVRGYWWGVRHIFRSNRAVEDFAHDLYQHASTLELATVIAGGTFNVFSAAVAGGSAWYIYQMARDLRHYNAVHSKSKIRMDINEALAYSFAVWHD